MSSATRHFRRREDRDKAISTSAMRCSSTARRWCSTAGRVVPERTSSTTPQTSAGTNRPPRPARNRLDGDVERLPGFRQALAPVAQVAERRALEATGGE